MTWKFLDVAAIEALQKQQIDLFGGSHGLRDRGLLESAVMRAENKANYDPDASLPTLAASLAWGLIKNHPFIDGNKRAGLVGMVVFLKLNGYRLTCTADDETAMVLRAAASEISEAEWIGWVERSTSPVSA